MNPSGKVEMANIQPFDIIETPGFVQPRLYQVQGIYHGALGQESTVELSAYDMTAPGSDGKAIFVPLEMLSAGINSGLFTITNP